MREKKGGKGQMEKEKRRRREKRKVQRSERGREMLCVFKQLSLDIEGWDEKEERR